MLSPPHQWRESADEPPREHGRTRHPPEAEGRVQRAAKERREPARQPEHQDRLGRRWHEEHRRGAGDCRGEGCRIRPRGGDGRRWYCRVCHEVGVLIPGRDGTHPDAGGGVDAGSPVHEQGRARDGGLGRVNAGHPRHRPLPHRVGRHPRRAGARRAEDGGAGRGGRRVGSREHNERADRHGQVGRRRHHVDEPRDGRSQRHRRQWQHADAGSRRCARDGPADQGQDVRREHPVGRCGSRQHDQSGRPRGTGAGRSIARALRIRRLRSLGTGHDLPPASAGAAAALAAFRGRSAP